jgi:hypothetical protein
MSGSCQRDVMNLRILWKVGNLLPSPAIIGFWRKSFPCCNLNHLFHYLCSIALIFLLFLRIFLFIFSFFCFPVHFLCFRFNLLSFLFLLFYFNRLYYVGVFLVLVLNKPLFLFKAFIFFCLEPQYVSGTSGERLTLIAGWHSSQTSICEHAMSADKNFLVNATCRW